MSIEIKNLFKSYEKNIDVLKNINLVFEPGDIVGIVGKNGAGKSTLVQAISGLTKFNRGEINFFNFLYDGKKRKFKKIQNSISYCFQNPDTQLLKISIFSEISFFGKNMKIQNLETLTNKTLDKYNLFKLKDDSPFKQSFGIKRKINIAASTNVPTKLLIFDEPTANLDYQNQKEVTQIIKSLMDEKDKIILVISHDENFLWEITNKIVHLNNGEIAKYSSTQDFYTDQNYLKKHNLTLPKIIDLSLAAKLENINSIKTIDDFIKEYGKTI